jgi:hypothetical protein
VLVMGFADISDETGMKILLTVVMPQPSQVGHVVCRSELKSNFCKIMATCKHVRSMLVLGPNTVPWFKGMMNATGLGLLINHLGGSLRFPELVKEIYRLYPILDSLPADIQIRILWESIRRSMSWTQGGNKRLGFIVQRARYSRLLVELVPVFLLVCKSWRSVLIQSPREFAATMRAFNLTENPLHIITELTESLPLFKSGFASYPDLVDARTPAGETILHTAAFYASPPIVDCILGLPTVNVNHRDDAGNTPLHLVFLRRDASRIASIVRLLLARGADPNVANNKSASALHALAERDDIDEGVHKQLLDSRADPNLRNCDGKTPFHLVCERGSECRMVMYHRCGANWCQSDEFGVTPEQLARENNINPPGSC